jgi:hypothetical protein
MRSPTQNFINSVPFKEADEQIAATSSPQPPSFPSFDSQIISDIPDLSAEFREKQISLLWRGSRDSFCSKDFQHQCDDHSDCDFGHERKHFRRFYAAGMGITKIQRR